MSEGDHSNNPADIQEAPVVDATPTPSTPAPAAPPAGNGIQSPPATPMTPLTDTSTSGTPTRVVSGITIPQNIWTENEVETLLSCWCTPEFHQNYYSERSPFKKKNMMEDLSRRLRAAGVEKTMVQIRLKTKKLLDRYRHMKRQAEHTGIDDVRAKFPPFERLNSIFQGSPHLARSPAARSSNASTSAASVETSTNAVLRALNKTTTETARAAALLSSATDDRLTNAEDERPRKRARTSQARELIAAVENASKSSLDCMKAIMEQQQRLFNLLPTLYMDLEGSESSETQEATEDAAETEVEAPPVEDAVVVVDTISHDDVNTDEAGAAAQQNAPQGGPSPPSAGTS